MCSICSFPNFTGSYFFMSAFSSCLFNYWFRFLMISSQYIIILFYCFNLFNSIKYHIELVPFTYTQNWKACWPFEFFNCTKSLVAYNILRIENPGHRLDFLVTKRLAVVKCTQDRKPWQLLLFFMYESARRLKYTLDWN